MVHRSKKSIYGQYEAARLWYENFHNDLLDSVLVASKVDTYLFMSKTVMCVVYLYDCLFWARKKSDINNSVNYFKEDGPSYNWGHLKEIQCLDS